MILPNKAISFDASLLSKFPGVLQCMGLEKMSVLDLYYGTQDMFDDISQFIMTIETLFVLNKIELIDGELKRC